MATSMEGLSSNGSSVAAFDIDGRAIPAGKFTDYSASLFVPPASSLIGKNLTVLVGYASDLDSVVIADNMRLDATVPEPSAAALLLGTSLLALRRRKPRV